VQKTNTLVIKMGWAGQSRFIHPACRRAGSASSFVSDFFLDFGFSFQISLLSNA
jgi:hypothetical protein